MNRLQRRRNKAPLPPAAFQTPPREGNRGVRPQHLPDPLKIRRPRIRVEMDRDIVASRRQTLRLGDDALRVFVAQQDVGNFRHIGNDCPRFG